MKIKINGEDTVLEKETVTMSELLQFKDVKMPEMVSVEFNGDMLDRELFATTIVKEGDVVEFLYFMGGGAF